MTVFKIQTKYSIENIILICFAVFYWNNAVDGLPQAWKVGSRYYISDLVQE